MPIASEGRVYLQRVSLGSFTCAIFGQRQWQYGEHCGTQWVPRSACYEGMDKTVFFQFMMLQLGSRRYWDWPFILTFAFSVTLDNLFPSFLRLGEMIPASLCLSEVCFQHFRGRGKVFSCRLPQRLLNGNQSGRLLRSHIYSQVCTVGLRLLPRKCKTLGSMPSTGKENLLPRLDFLSSSPLNLSGIWGNHQSVPPGGAWEMLIFVPEILKAF